MPENRIFLDLKGEKVDRNEQYIPLLKCFKFTAYAQVCGGVRMSFSDINLSESR